MSVDRLRSRMIRENLDAFLVSRPQNVRYLSGYTGADSYLLVLPDKVLFVTDPRYTEQAKAECPGCEIVNWREQGSSAAEALARLLRTLNVRSAAFESDHLTYRAYADMEGAASCRLIPVSGVVEAYRATKRPDEIARLKTSCEIADRALARLLRDLKPGVTEKEMAARLSLYLVEEGSDPQPYGDILISGKRTSLLHGIPSEKKLEKGDLVLMDFGGAFQGYLSDMTRTVVLGTATSEQRDIYALERAMFDAARERIRAGVPAAEIYEASVRPLKGSRWWEYHYTGIGHGIGLFVHETPFLSPVSKDVLEENMVITLEPGIYVPGWGGVRLENQLLVTRDGFIDLTQSTRELLEIPIRG